MSSDEGAPQAIDISGDGGLLKAILVPGVGHATPPAHSKVTVHYVGTLLDGTKFDSSRDRSDPFKFSLGEGSVIKGWDQGVATMRLGEKAILTCGPEYAYGKSGSPPKIPANATLKFEVELLGWSDETDVTPDGGITKKITTAAERDQYSSPNDRAVCQITVRGYLPGQEANPFMSKENVTVELPVDAAYPEGLDQAIKSMKTGEKATFTLKRAYGYGEFGSQFSVSPNDIVKFDIELLSFVNGKNSWSMDIAEKIEATNKIKAQGNEYFKQGNMKRAMKLYQTALDLVKNVSEDKKAAESVIISLHSNLAACQIKTNSLADAKKSCDAALALEPDNVKVLFRRSQICVSLSDEDSALKDLNRALSIDPTNASIKALSTKVKQSIKAAQAKERRAFSGIFDRMSKQETTVAMDVERPEVSTSAEEEAN